MYCATLSKGFNIDEYQFKDFYKIECHQHVGCLEKKDQSLHFTKVMLQSHN